jgi:hypothetical protein
MRLPGTEQWAREDLAAQIAFERTFAEAVPHLLELSTVLGWRDAADEQQQISEWIFALGRAAELAFATEDVDLGLQICREIENVKAVGSLTPMQLAFYAAICALIGSVEIRLDAQGVSIARTVHAQRFLHYAWPFADSIHAVRMMRHFIPAAAASGPPTSSIGPWLDTSEVVKPQALAALRMSLEYRSLDTPHSDDRSRLRAIQAMEENYAAQLELMRSEPHWKIAEPKGSIIDWSLLCIWVSVLRFRTVAVDAVESLTTSEEGSFIRWLASEIQQKRPRRVIGED